MHGIITEAYDRAEEILTLYRGALDKLAEHLIAHETIEGEELEQLFRNNLGALLVPKRGSGGLVEAGAS